MKQFILFILVAYLPLSHAKKVVEASSDHVSAAQITMMSYKELQALKERLDLLKSGAVSLTGGGIDQFIQRMQVIDQLAEIEAEESVDILLGVVRSELSRPPDLVGTKAVSTVRADVIEKALGAVAKIGTQADTQKLDKMQADLRRFRSSGGFFSALSEFTYSPYEATRSEMARRTKPLPNVSGLMLQYTTDFWRSGEYLEQLEQLLNEQIFDDPDTVEALVMMEATHRLDGPSNRNRPDLIYLMGAPGTGKTSAAKAFTNALHNDMNAWQKHMFVMPRMRLEHDGFQALGSTVGLIGSDKFPTFFKFLVEHSDGKYMMVSTKSKEGNEVFKIELNPEYKGETLPGYFPPSSAVVFIDEFHDWSEDQKNRFLKTALEDGTFALGSANGGEEKITVPVRFVIGSNEGTNLTVGRDARGPNAGVPQTYEMLYERYVDAKNNPELLRDEVMATNLLDGPNVGQSRRGISPEMVDRVAPHLHLMQPSSPTTLRMVVDRELKTLAKNQRDRKGLLAEILGDIEMEWGDDLLKTIQEYDYVPERNARPVVTLTKLLINRTLLYAARERGPDGERKFKPSKHTKLHLSIKQNDDLTKTLVIRVTPLEGEAYTIEQPIKYTQKDKKHAPMTDDRIDELLDLSSRLKGVVFGMDDVLDKISNWLITLENERHSKTPGSAKVILLDGLSSTGKTELAKQLYRLISPDKGELEIFNFGNIQTKHDIETEILGSKNPATGTVTKSRFMKLYDKYNGRITVAFDELANSNPELLKLLYDLMREPSLNQWADGKWRSMKNVTIIATGNSTLRAYRNVPAEAPFKVRMAAYKNIYLKLRNNWDHLVKLLTEDYPEPLLNRFGADNVIPVAPHTYRSLRELAQLKVGLRLKDMRYDENDASKRGWNVVFADRDEYINFIDMIIEEGFKLDGQGASIDSFVKDFKDRLNALLLVSKVPSQANVLLKHSRSTDNHNKDALGRVVYTVYVEGEDGRRQLEGELELTRPYVSPVLEQNDTEVTLTAWHEAGHNLLSHALFKGFLKPTQVSIKPGVDLFGHQWLLYLGIASFDELQRMAHNRAYVVRQVALMLGGAMAERIASGDHDAGKSNDIERAATLIQMAILKFGLEPAWKRAIPSNMKVEDFLKTLTNEERIELNRLTQAYFSEGERLAEAILLRNYKQLASLGNLLAMKGELDGEEIESFYAGQEAIVVPHHAIVTGDGNQRAGAQDASAEEDMQEGQPFRVGAIPVTHHFPRQLLAQTPRPSGPVINIEKLLNDERQAEYDQVPLPAALPVWGEASAPEVRDAVKGDCAQTLKE